MFLVKPVKEEMAALQSSLLSIHVLPVKEEMAALQPALELSPLLAVVLLPLVQCPAPNDHIKTKQNTCQVCV